MYWKGLDEVDLLRKRAESQDTKAWKQKEAEEEGEEKGWGINPSGQTEAGQNVAAEGSSFCLQILAGCLGSELKIIFWFLYMAHRQPFCAGFSPHREGSFFPFTLDLGSQQASCEQGQYPFYLDLQFVSTTPLSIPPTHILILQPRQKDRFLVSPCKLLILPGKVETRYLSIPWDIAEK